MAFQKFFVGIVVLNIVLKRIIFPLLTLHESKDGIFTSITRVTNFFYDIVKKRRHFGRRAKIATNLLAGTRTRTTAEFSTSLFLRVRQ
jgi:hypothetical protein